VESGIRKVPPGRCTKMMPVGRWRYSLRPCALIPSESKYHQKRKYSQLSHTPATITVTATAPAQSATTFPLRVAMRAMLSATARRLNRNPAGAISAPRAGGA